MNKCVFAQVLQNTFLNVNMHLYSNRAQRGRTTFEA